ncbi:MAG: nitroreductase family protein [Bacilli bacterium]|nr:nitroreductase family protein [Bacilli bacterium]
MENETYRTIMNRHSCRKFKDKEIDDGILEAIVEAGLSAPTAKNMQGTYFLTLKDKEAIAEVSKLNAKAMNMGALDPFYGAKAVIVVLYDKKCLNGIYDGSIAMAQMSIAAESFGLGNTWIHRAKEVFETEEGKAILKRAGFPEGEYVGVGNLILGYPEEESRRVHPIVPNRSFKI